MNREYHKWYSPRLHRQMELLVFGHAGAKVLVFPTRCGRFYEYEELRLVESIRDKVEGGHLQLYCVDSIDAEGLYAYWMQPEDRVRRHMAYQEYCIYEVLPLMELKNSHPCVISHGCSLGAYHAANIAFRYPWKFQKLAAFSGRYDVTLNVENFRDLFDGYYDSNVYFNNPSHYLPGLNDARYLKPLRKMDIVLVIGAEDPFLADNQHISQTLSDKGIAHHMHIWGERAHRGYYWRRMAPLYL